MEQGKKACRLKVTGDTRAIIFRIVGQPIKSAKDAPFQLLAEVRMPIAEVYLWIPPEHFATAQA